MANYGYIQKIKPPLDKETFLAHVQKAVHDFHGDRWKVEWADFAHDGPTLLVTIPGTAAVTRQYWGGVAPEEDEDVGFVVSLQDKHTIAFRHGPNSQFADWARGCIEELLSQRLKAPLHYDAGPTTYKPGRREYRRGKTLREYLLRNFKGKERADWQNDDFFKRLMRGAPPGFDT